MIPQQSAHDDRAVNVTAFLTQLRRLDIALVADGDRLQCDAPAGVLTGELRDQIRHRKREIVEFLRAAEAIGRRPKAIVPLRTDSPAASRATVRRLHRSSVRRR